MENFRDHPACLPRIVFFDISSQLKVAGIAYQQPRTLLFQNDLFA